MKRLICLTIVITMLVGLCITTRVSASVPTYTTYKLNSSEFITGWSPTGTYYSADGFSSYFGWKNAAESGAVQDLASNPNGRYGKEVYKVTNNNNDIIVAIQQENIKDVRFNEGDIVHLTSEMMIPKDQMTLGEYSDYKIGIALSPLFGTKTGDEYNVSTSFTGSNDNGIRVENRGKKNSKIYAYNMIAGMDMETQRFTLFGNVNTQESWEYDKWYRFDVALTMGANPTVSIYVNGNPLTVEPEKVPKEPTEEDPLDYVANNFDNTDATFDGIHTASENVSVGTWLNDGSGAEVEFKKYGLYGFDGVALVRAVCTAKSTVYIGDLIYRAMEAGSDVELPEALSLVGVKDGGFFDPADLTAVEVQVPEFIKHKTASVELWVDGDVVPEASAGVYDLSNIGGGDKAITLTAKNAQGNTLRTSSMTITLPGESVSPVENDIHGKGAVTFGNADNAALAETYFQGFWNSFFVNQGEGFYWNSSPRNYGGHTAGYRIITASGGPEGADDYYAKLERDDSVSGKNKTNILSLAYRYNSARWGSAAGEPKVWNDGIVHLSYDLLMPALDDANANWAPTNADGALSTDNWESSFYMHIGNSYGTKAVNMIRLPNRPGYTSCILLEGALTGRGGSVPMTLGAWSHQEWKLDYVNHTAELTVEGNKVLNDNTASPYYGTTTLEMNPSHAIYNGFEGVAFNWLGSKGSVGVDNLEVKYELVKPYVKSIDFGTENAQGRNVLTTATTAAVEIPGKVFSADGSVNMASYVSLVDSDGNAVTGASASMAADGKTVNVKIPSDALIAGEDYSIKLSGNVPIGREGHTQTGTDAGDYTVKSAEVNSEYKFTAVDSFEGGLVDDGVADAITVKDVRFTTHAHRVDEKPLFGYAGAGLTEGYKLRADMIVSNGSDSAQNIAMIVATYSGDELVSVAVGGDTIVPAGAKNLTITSAPIVIGENTNLTAKVFLLNSLGTLSPLSYAYDILGNVAQ